MDIYIIIKSIGEVYCLMKKIIRLTESELHGVVEKSVKKYINTMIQEQHDMSLLLQAVAQGIAEKNEVQANADAKNTEEVELGGDKFAAIEFYATSNAYMRNDDRRSSYDIPNDTNLVEDPQIEIISITYYDGNGEGFEIQDNGIVKQALEGVVNVRYDNTDIPSEEDYFYTEE